MAQFTPEFQKNDASPAEDARLDSAAFHRNQLVICDALTSLLRDSPGDVLEIGSGTGQHATAFARALPQLTWWPTDYLQSHLQSIDAWRQDSGLPNIKPPCQIDASENDWNLGAECRPPSENLAAILSINVLHISPWDIALGIFKAAGRHLAKTGTLIFYGPFKTDGHHTAESNASFDAALRAENPSWGVRDICDLNACATDQGLASALEIPMPKNNFILAFRKTT